MLTQEQIDQFHHDGFLNGGRIFADDEVAELSEDLERIMDIGPNGFDEDAPKPVLFRDLAAGGYETDDRGEGPTPVWQIVNIWEASKAFEKLIYHPAVVGAISQLTGFADLQVWHDQIQYKPDGNGGPTGWHQDAPLWPSIEPMTPVSAWIPFDDAEVENGCMWMVPGSHQWGNQMEYLRGFGNLKRIEEFGNIGEDFEAPEGTEVSEAKAVPRPVMQGEVHFHHSLTWHGSPMNPSPRTRRAIAIHYMTGEARYTGRAHAMSQFIEIEVGAPMLNAGPHFPSVCKAGEPVSFAS
jgi:phytanoyl-CoA hydroxylase